jgi:hypothetical protein
MEVKIRVRLLNNPVLWCWELVDPASGTVRENSWSSEWEAYGSPEEALRAASARLMGKPYPPSARGQAA